VDNAEIADRLDAFAAALQLGDANPYTIRAYQRAAETIRHSGVPVVELVAAGRGRELRGIGPGIEARLRELVATGQIAELAELEREVVPDLVGLGRYLGLSAQRAIDIARALGIRTAGELRAAAAGRLREVPGIGPKTEAQIVSALARETDARSRRGVWLSRAWELVGGIARALDAEPAGDVRRWCDSCHRLAVVRAASRPDAVLAQFAELPQIVAVIEQGERHAVGVTVDGVPVALTVPEPSGFGTALMRATGSPEYVAALEPLDPLPARPSEDGVYAALGVPWCPPELREAPFRGEPPSLVEMEQIRGDLHCHTTWSDGRVSVAEMARAARARGYEYLAICDHTPAVGAVQGLGPDDSAARVRRSRRPTRSWLRSGYCEASSATSSPTGGSTSPTTCSLSSTGSRPASTVASECRARR